MSNHTLDDNLQTHKNTRSIIMPPPNVTGSLHMGHALTYTIQDVLIRYWSSLGFDTLWQPGFDHAGIATQMVAEKKLIELGKSRASMSRDEFVSFIHQNTEQSMEMIRNQVSAMNMSVDWTISRFTLDDLANESVNLMFNKLYADGCIYKDTRLINWDAKLQTSISDLEVVNKKRKGNLYHIKYQIICDDKDYIIVATTRPETLFGDIAIAVNPNDERFSSLIGKKAIVPICGRIIPIIADEYADIEKGSGAVKITPAHDFNDFEVGKRHNLEAIDIFDNHCNLNNNSLPEFVGMHRDAAHKLIVVRLEALGLLEKIEQVEQSVPHGDRSGEVIEPRMSLQWFVATEKLVGKAIDVVEKDEIKFYPDHWKSTYINWLQEIQPWCISRQLVWGHQIPAWYDSEDNIYVAMNEGEAHAKAKLLRGKAVELHRDNDVLDTWFSSAMWPFSSLGWPDTSQATQNKLANYYPSTVLVTGFDIIFFWVARMVMMGMYCFDKVPFHSVYITPIICDANGDKMSKSKGNAQDPMEIIAENSASELRISLLLGISSKRHLKFSSKDVVIARNFLTKLRNAMSFCDMNISKFTTVKHTVAESLSAMINNAVDIETHSTINLLNDVRMPFNAWIIREALESLRLFDSHMENFRLHDAVAVIKNFIWSKFCDWYIEIVKVYLSDNSEIATNACQNIFDKHNSSISIDIMRSETVVVLNSVRNLILSILHPFVPEFCDSIYTNIQKSEISQMNTWSNNDNIHSYANLWRRFIPQNTDAKSSNITIYDNNLFHCALAEAAQKLIDIIEEIRSIKSVVGIGQQDTCAIQLVTQNQLFYDYIQANRDVIKKRCNVANVHVTKSNEIEQGDYVTISHLHSVDINFDQNALSEHVGLNDKLVKIEREIGVIDLRLKNSNFVARAPEDVIEQLRNELTMLNGQKDKIVLCIRAISKAI
jgi:valyl-tRNA synthetase